MTSTISRGRLAATMVFIAAMCSVSDVLGAQAPSLVGRLATVEPSARRITIVPEGQVQMLELFVEDESELVQDEAPLTLSDLVIRVGRRVTVTYRDEGDRRIAVRVTVEAD